ncbi:helix-turn-helix transcriptional regulator [Streptomyces halobius]|uniref:Helix-turn-helix transcriptional regulator n=1 Tax=Streptomyces halobius TaxID=2879846 RepID=A0ABY4M430_9ACTN|nr:helix-turn-helix transcriptional regulator [Streptomyces halobius]UQA92526.1 helix-turn-helix transcriptional regulator [Streptomyces halobius]
MTEGWYGKLERGKLDHVGDEFLESIVRVLDLNDAQRAHLFLEANKCEPPPRPRPDARTIDPVVSAIIHQLPWPAYTFDQRWDIRVFNKAAARDYPWMLHGINVMIWALTYREARLQLSDWEEKWAKPMASQLRIAHKANPDDARLNEVCDEIKQRDEVARRILVDDVTTVIHPDGDRRRLFLPHRDEEVEVEFQLRPDEQQDPSHGGDARRDPSGHQGRHAGCISEGHTYKAAMPSTMAQVPDGTPGTPASA